MTDIDRIEKIVTLRAPVARVWRALTDPSEFATWFGIALDGPFVAGRTLTGTFRGSVDEALLMNAQRQVGVRPSRVRLPGPHAVFCTVERVEVERCLSFRWVPYAVDEEADPDHEPTTLVELTLEPVAEGTRLTVVESGFGRVPPHRRERALRMNEGGWAQQTENLRRHVEAQ